MTHASGPPRDEDTSGLSRDDFTESLTKTSAGHAPSAAALLSCVYDELRRLAAGALRQERPDHTLQPTALVHEAYLRLVDQSRVDWKGRTHFRAIAALAMRRVLIDHARSKKSLKRGGDYVRIPLDEMVATWEQASTDLIDLHEALDRLALINERQAKVVEMRFFGGMTVEDVAQELGLSSRSVATDWSMARAWLHRELADSST